MGRPKEIIDPKIGKRLRLIREHMTFNGKKLSRDLFAEHYDVSTQAVAYWETGKRKVPQRIIEDISETLGIDIDFILGKYDTPNLQSLMKKWDVELTPKVIQGMKLIEYIEFLLGHSINDQLDQDEVGSYLQEIDDFIIFKYNQITKRKEDQND